MLTRSCLFLSFRENAFFLIYILYNVNFSNFGKQVKAKEMYYSSLIFNYVSYIGPKSAA